MTALTDRIQIQQGDLTEMDVDAIVNAANNDLILGAGVAGVIARHIIHAASMSLGGMRTTAKTLRTSTAHSLRLAAERNLKSIAFPAIGTGVSGFPMDECAKIMLTEALQHLKGETSLETIHFVLFDARSRDIFQSTWQTLQKENSTGAASA